MQDKSMTMETRFVLREKKLKDRKDLFLCWKKMHRQY